MVGEEELSTAVAGTDAGFLDRLCMKDKCAFDMKSIDITIG
jgi:hypothetical protein